MNAKNLPLKFTILSILVAVCVWSVAFTEPNYSIDLKGGHSLVYEMYLKETDTKDIVDKTVSILKQRLDPLGLRGLVITSLVGNRIEIRMPAAKAESQGAKIEYMRSLDKLKGGNLRRSDLQRVLYARDEIRRDQAIDGLSATNDPNKLRALVADYLAIQKAQADYNAADAQLPSAKTDAERKTLQEAKDKADAELKNRRIAYMDKERDLLDAGNVNILRLQTIVRNYVSPVERVAMLKESAKREDEINDQMNRYRASLKRLREENPTRQAHIDEVAQAYEKWSNVRQYLDDPADLKRMISKAGVLEFRISPVVPESSGEPRITKEQRDRFLKILREEGPEGLQKRHEGFGWFPIRGEREGYANLVVADYEGRDYMLLYDQPGSMMLGGTRAEQAWRLDDAAPGVDQFNKPAVDFKFDATGAKLFSRLTSDHINHAMAILLDDEVYSSPNIRSAISERGQVTGVKRNEVTELVHTLQSGSLPARINPNPVAENTFGPAMGQENLRLAKTVAIWSVVAVSVFMIIYYHIPGAIAVLAMFINTLFTLGAMNLVLNVAYSLPGIAGIILSIGMAVDANVLIYERLREEQAKGLSIRQALKNSYERAFSAIFDSNITTLLSCAILGWVGTEEVRGFAITLGLGVVFNLFTAVTMTRWLFQVMLEKRIVTRALSMFHIIRTPNIDWMGKRYYFWGISIVTAVLGIIALAMQGSDIWGIEFSSGTRAVIRLKDSALLGDPDKGGAASLPNDAIVRKLFGQKARAGGYEKLLSTATVTTVADPGRLDGFMKRHDRNGDGKIEMSEWPAENRGFFEALDQLGDRNGVLTRDVLSRRLPPASYEISTTETRVPVIQAVAREAFGTALVQRQAIEYALMQGRQQRNLNVALNSEGYARITRTVAERADQAYRSQLLDYVDTKESGALFVIDCTTPVTADDVNERIRQMRFQPDFSAQALSSWEVIGLAGADANARTFKELAIIVKPVEPVAPDSKAWTAFVAGEKKLLEEALRRVEAMETTNFDPAIAGETAQAAIMALILAWVAMIAYLWIRFGSLRWGLAAVIMLVHDTVIVTGMVGISDWLHRTYLGSWLGIDSFKLDLTMVTAILTMIGYSVNDTIVVYDRIRENRGKLTALTPTLINASINQTLSRTLLTSSTVFLVLLIMYIWGGPGVHGFSYAMLIGVIDGTYSSIAVAAPLLLGFKAALISRTEAAVPATEA
jgi:SecD/SecF fusion protein